MWLPGSVCVHCTPRWLAGVVQSTVDSGVYLNLIINNILSLYILTCNLEAPVDNELEHVAAVAARAWATAPIAAGEAFEACALAGDLIAEATI